MESWPCHGARQDLKHRQLHFRTFCGCGNGVACSPPAVTVLQLGKQVRARGSPLCHRALFCVGLEGGSLPAGMPLLCGRALVRYLLVPRVLLQVPASPHASHVEDRCGANR